MGTKGMRYSQKSDLPIHYLREDEVSQLLENTERRRDKMVIQLLVNTGLRVAELCGLQPDDIRGQMLTVRKEIAKTGVERQIPLNESAIESVNYFTCQARMNNRKRLMPVGVRGIQRIIDHAADGLNLSIKVTPHKLRHTFGHLLIKSGRPTRIVQVLLGHASLSSTEIYTGIDRESLEEAVRSIDLKRTHCPA
jgi:site-specific recombinase XerD